MNRRTSTVACFLGACLLFVGSFAVADDFFPPPWPRPSAPNPQAITAEWEFFAPAAVLTPIAPDGPLTDLTFASGLAPGGNFAAVSPSGVWVPGDGDGAWAFPTPGSIHFELDNVLDFEPVKHIWMQVTHSPGLLDVDPLAPFNFAATGSTPTVPIVTPIDPTHTLITWDMFPNPPWEEFDLLVLSDMEIDQVLIDTISIPEPSTLVLSGLGLMVMGFVVWRRRRP